MHKDHRGESCGLGVSRYGKLPGKFEFIVREGIDHGHVSINTPCGAQCVLSLYRIYIGEGSKYSDRVCDAQV